MFMLIIMAFHAQRSWCDLAAFIDRYGNALPKTVRVVDGFCGANDDDTLDPDQVLLFHRLETEKAILGLDEYRQEICIQENSNTKVYLLPLECSTFETVQELTNVQWSFILVLEDILTTGIVSGSKLKLLRDEQSSPHCLKCQIVFSQDEFRDVLLPLHVKGKFLPLLDPSEYYLHEILAYNHLPVNVRFISDSSKPNTRFASQSLAHLGHVLLTHKTEATMVFAASFNHDLSLYVFPRTLDITVSLRSDDSTEASDKVKECKRLLQENDCQVKQLDNAVKESFYFTANPVRRFRVQLPKKTCPIPLPRSRYDSKARDKASPGSIKPLPRRKLLPKNSGDAQKSEPGAVVKPITDNKGLGDVFEYSSSSEISHEVNYKDEFNSEVPAVPPKTRSYSRGTNEAKTVKLHSPSSFEPTSRNQLVTMAEYEDVPKDYQVVQADWREANNDEYSESAQRKGNPEPELPPKPVFLRPLLADTEENNSLMPQDSPPPPLPPRKDGDSCPEELVEKKENVAFIRSKNPLPVLPPRKELSDVAYKVVDVTNWKWYEDQFAYTEVKDEGHVISQDSAGTLQTQSDICGSEPQECAREKERQRDGESSYEIKDYRGAEEIGAEEDNEEDGTYEEIDTWCTSPSTEENLLKTNTNPQKKKVTVPSTNPSTPNNVKCPTQTSQEKPAIASSRRLKKELIISNRCEEDFMDFKDIEQFLKLRKKLNDLRDHVNDLEKKVGVKEGPGDESHELSSTIDEMASSYRFDRVENRTDENRNIFISVRTLNKFKVGSESRNVGLDKDGTEKSTGEETSNSNSPVNTLDSDDGDEAYAECCEREFSHIEDDSACYMSNSEQGRQSTGDSAEHGVESVNYNTVEVGTSSYLQLENSNEEVENVYVNVDAEDFDQEAQWGKVKELPPLPPKKRTNSTC